MIGRQEILETAATLGLNPHVVEKDYVLGWVLAGISTRRSLKRGSSKVERASGGHRGYRVDRIEGVQATAEGFEPRYAVEVSPQGPLKETDVAAESS